MARRAGAHRRRARHARPVLSAARSVLPAGPRSNRTRRAAAARVLTVMSGLMAVIFDFDGVILDSETTEFEAHRLMYEQCGVALTPDEWCDQIGVWVDGHAGRWFKRLSELSDRAPDLRTFEAEKH